MKKQDKIEPLINTARDEFQVTKEFPLIITLDTPTGKALVVANYNSNEVYTSDTDTKKLLESEISIRLKGNKRYVTVPWVEVADRGYYLDDKAGIIPVRDRLADNILLKGCHRLSNESEIMHLAITAWENSNYIVIGSHYGLSKTDWSKYLVIPTMTQNGSVVFILNPDTEEYMPFISYRNINAPFRGYELKDEVKSTEPEIARHELGITKYMRQARGLISMKKWGSGKLTREAILYQTPNHIFMNIDGIEYKAEKVPPTLADLDEGLELYNIHTHKLTACIGVIKGRRKSKAILTVKARYVDTGLNWYDKIQCAINNTLCKGKKYGVGDFMNIDFALVDKPVSLATLNYDTKAELINRASYAHNPAIHMILN